MLVLCLSFVIAALDQFTKYVVRNQFFPGEVLPVVRGFLNLTYVRNTGAAWGVFDGFNRWLAALSVLVLALMLIFHRTLFTGGRVQRAALGLMVGGIVGNLLDRVRLAFVVDFLDFHSGVHHFPSFNVADAAICTGVGLYVLSSLWLSRRASAAQP